MTKLNKKIGFIGAGKMGGAIIKGLISSGYVCAEDIMASEFDEKTAVKTSEELGIAVFTDNKFLTHECDIIILAVKPYFIKDILLDVQEFLTPEKLVVSIAAGISTIVIEEVTGIVPIVRVMPNTPALVNEGMSAVCKGTFASEEDVQTVKEIFSKVGKCVVLGENLIDAVTGISGSGPAFAYTIIEAMADGGVKIGLPKATAIELAAQTMLGAAKMILETGKHPSVLKDEVTTPGGTTAAGLAVMEECAIRSVLIKTVEQTAKKASELGKK